MREPMPSGRPTWRFKAKLQDQYLEGKGVDASQALAGDGLHSGGSGGEQAHPGHQPGLDA